MSVRDLIIIGAGPSGLATAIAAKRRGLDYQVVEQGALVNSIDRFPPQMVFFTTPELLEIGGLPLVSPYEKPTRVEALKYYRRVVDAYDLRVSLGEQVMSVTREPSGADDAAVFVIEHAIDARCPADAGGAVRGVCDRLLRSPQPHRRGGRRSAARPSLLPRTACPLPARVVIVGGGNSAAESALEHVPGRRICHHRPPSARVEVDHQVLGETGHRQPHQGRLGRLALQLNRPRDSARFIVIGPAGGDGPSEEIAMEAVYLLTGYRADSELMTRAGITLNEREAPVHDPMTFETNVPGIFVAGGAIAGVDTGTIFIENGRFHGEKIVEAIAARCADRR